MRYGKYLILFLIVLFPLVGLATEKDNLANYYPPQGAPTSYIDKYGNVIAPAITAGVLTVTSGLTRVNLATTGDGTVSNAVASVVERVAEIKSTVITLTNVVLTTTTGTAEGESQEVYVFDDGAVTVLGAVMNGVLVSSGGITGTVLYVAVGTVAAADDGDLTGTEADIIPKTTIDQSAAGVTTNDFDAILATVAIFDGTSTAMRIHINLAIDQDGQEFNATNTFTGALTVYYTKPVDNQ